MLRYSVIAFFLFFAIYGYSQTVTKIEQLKSNISAAKKPDQKLNALLDFCDQWESYSPDTLKKYAEEAKQLSIAQKNTRAGIVSDYYLAVWLFQANKLDTAFNLINVIIATYKKQFPYDEMYVKMYALKGNVLLRTAKMDELLALDLEWMKESELHQDTLGTARAALGVGNVNSRLKKYTETLHWYHYALSLMENSFYKKKLSFLYSNLCVIFYHLDNEDSAMYYINQGIEFSRQEGNLTNLANALSLKGGLEAEYNHLKEAEGTFKEEIEVRKKIGDVYYLIADMTQVALFYAQTAPQKGIDICKEALMLAEKNGNDFQSLNSIYSSLGKCYEAVKDYKGYGEALMKQSELKDSIYAKSSAEAMVEMQTKYDLQKKETTIAQQKLSLISKNYQLFGSLVLLLIVLVSGYIIFKQYRRKQKLKLELMQQEEKLKAEKAVGEAEEKERKRIAADLHDSLGAYAASIASNIDHLRVTEPSNQAALQQLRVNSMAIVSQLGDTIWALKKDALSLTSISDRIKIFVQKIQSSYAAISFDVFETIQTDYLLAPSQAFHLFQIVKEAVNNAVRHSQCDYLAINIIGDKIWKITISDNGKGMIPKITLSEGGNGLINMQTRAKESGWKIEWQANKPAGTQVIIEPTIN